MIVPLAGHVLIKQEEAETKTSAGIFLAETAVEKPARGTVIEVGDSYYENGIEKHSPVSKEDVVIYKKWGGDDVKDGSQEYKLVRFEDLMAIIR